MSTRATRLNDILSKALVPIHMEIENESFMHSVPPGSETHFKVLVVSEKFTGKSRIDRQRMINELLKEELQSGLHALTQKTLTPEEWEKQKTALNFESPECLGGSKHDRK
ncbi:transcriptional regulator BolA [Bdellovibrio bacteriovorus]|uniref:Transcriptional regulator BolA n=1 Tax=Bdellovibrio bacteriovorus TaxID=959 RepID=A0A162FZJ2_BDEBC|nr:BolA family protein [Bdellovibrio bacteriovorus]KYG62870.1 transcriptional regulator BolA [Bdellovibrio bacteriovorus]